MRIFAACMLFLFFVSGAFALDSVYTAADKCQDVTDRRDRDRSSEWRCKGPRGYAATFFDEGNVVGVRFGLTGKEADLGGLQWSGGIDAKKIEWRMSDGAPRAAILRISKMDPETSKMTSHLIVAKVTPAGGCLIALIDARAVDANMKAREVADLRALTHRCGDH